MNITVSYAGQDGTPRRFLMIIKWKKVAKDWKVASEIILPRAVDAGCQGLSQSATPSIG
jgi:hypothetical protein